MTIDYYEMRNWINNDECLYSWWKSSKLPITRFIQENKTELRIIIRKAIS